MATIVRRESGKWQAKVRRLGQTTSRTFANRADAEAWARAQESQIERGSWVNPVEARRTVFRDVLRAYREEICEPKNCPAELSRLRRLEEWFGHLRVDAITPERLMDWRDQRLLEVAGPTVRRELALLGGVMTWVQKELLIPLPQNPVSAIRAPKDSKGRERRLRGDEEARLTEAMERRNVPGSRIRKGSYVVGGRQPWLRPVFELALETGMRQGEILALKWTDIDLEACTAFVRHSKNGESRTVPLSSKAVAVLRAARSIRVSPNGKKSNVVSMLGAERFVPITADALKKAWTRTVERARESYLVECRDAGMEPDDRLTNLNFHDLRHEATSRLALKLSNVLELAAVTGHKDLRMLKRYYHPKASDLARKLG